MNSRDSLGTIEKEIVWTITAGLTNDIVTVVVFDVLDAYVSRALKPFFQLDLKHPFYTLELKRTSTLICKFT